MHNTQRTTTRTTMGCRQHQVPELRHLRSSRHHMADIVGAGCHPPSLPRTLHHSSSSVSPTEEDAHQPWTALVHRLTATASRPHAHILAHLRLLGVVVSGKYPVFRLAHQHQCRRQKRHRHRSMASIKSPWNLQYAQHNKNNYTNNSGMSTVPGACTPPPSVESPPYGRYPRFLTSPPISTAHLASFVFVNVPC